MIDLSTALADLGASLCRDVDVGGLFARNKVAHKWKAPWRALLLREVVAWRTHDLLQQSHALSKSESLLGALILLRSAFETIAVLIYLNQAMQSVVGGNLDFHAFSQKTSRLLLGSRDASTSLESINILSVLSGAGKSYQGLEGWYASLSEVAHPNYEGMVLGYSEADRENFITRFSNRWSIIYAGNHESSLVACLGVFEAEYNHVWPQAFEALERWVEANDSELEATKPSADAA
jgi:hypothetical protein